MKKFLFVLLCLSSAAFADETAITIYSKAQPGAVDPNAYRPVSGQQSYYIGNSVPGYAVVRQVRDVNLPANHTILKYKDVAAYIDPTTVQFKSLTDGKSTQVNEQNFQFDLVSQEKLLAKYIDSLIEIERLHDGKSEIIKGTLLSTQGGITIKTSDGKIQTINKYASIKFLDLPEGLITKPTLVWDITTNKTGMHKTEVSYQTDGITWWADYNLVFTEGKNANYGTVDFGSWVSILNQSGVSYNDAKLKLMAGDVQRIRPQNMMYEAKVMAMAADGSAHPAQFNEKSFFEYHLYTLNRPATIPDNSTKQLELTPKVLSVPAEKQLIFASDGQENKKLDVFLKMKNNSSNGLGIPLPAGRIRVNQRDIDGSLEFIGEDIIGHTPKDEDILVKLGQAFDVVGERKQISFSSDEKLRVAEEEYEITIKNHKEQKIDVIVKENLYRYTGWKIISSSHKWEKENSNRIKFAITVPANKSETIKYKVKYNW